MNVRTMAALLLLTLTIAASAQADAIPYQNAGTYNAASYSFKATATGQVDAYFCGSTAAWTETLGLMVNGSVVSSGVFNNQTTTVGAEYDLGSVNAGDTLTFFIKLVDSEGAGYNGMNVYSNPALNTGAFGGSYANHVYSTPFTGTSNIPVTGTFVGFEDNTPTDGTFGPTDWNYNDETFVFTNVSATTPEPATMGLLGLGLTGLLARRRKS